MGEDVVIDFFDSEACFLDDKNGFIRGKLLIKNEVELPSPSIYEKIIEFDTATPIKEDQTVNLQKINVDPLRSVFAKKRTIQLNQILQDIFLTLLSEGKTTSLHEKIKKVLIELTGKEESNIVISR